MIKSLLAKLAARLKEPSTYAGIATLLAAIGFNIDAALLQNITLGLSGILGAVAFVLPEGK